MNWNRAWLLCLASPPLFSFPQGVWPTKQLSNYIHSRGSTVLWVIETGTIVSPGDELVRLDTSQIEDNILAQEIVYENALANKITAESDVAVAEKSITEYLEGTFVEEQSAIEKEIFDAKQTLQETQGRNTLLNKTECFVVVIKIIAKK